MQGTLYSVCQSFFQQKKSEAKNLIHKLGKKRCLKVSVVDIGCFSWFVIPSGGPLSQSYISVLN